MLFEKPSIEPWVIYGLAFSLFDSERIDFLWPRVQANPQSSQLSMCSQMKEHSGFFLREAALFTLNTSMNLICHFGSQNSRNVFFLTWFLSSFAPWKSGVIFSTFIPMLYLIRKIVGHFFDRIVGSIDDVYKIFKIDQRSSQIEKAKFLELERAEATKKNYLNQLRKIIGFIRYGWRT